MRDHNCTKCSLSKGATNVCVHPYNLDKRPMFIILDSWESKLAVIDVLSLDETLDIGSEMYITALVKCEVDEFGKKHAEACLEYLIDELKVVRPATIMLCGEFVSDLILGVKYKENIGTVNYSNKLGTEFSNIPCYLNYDAKYILEHKNQASAFSKNTITKAYNISRDCHNAAKQNIIKIERHDNYRVVRSLEDLDQLIEYIKVKKVVSFDFETPGLNYHDGKLPSSLALSFQAHSGYFIPLWHYSRNFTEIEQSEILELANKPFLSKSEIERLKAVLEKKVGANFRVTEIVTFLGQQLNEWYLNFDEVITLSKEDSEFLVANVSAYEWSDDYLHQIIHKLETYVFGNPDIRKIAQNTKFDIHWGKMAGIKKWYGRFDDTALMHFAINNNRSHALKNIIKPYYPEEAGYEEERSQYPWEATPFNILAVYNCKDADMTMRLSTILESELLEDSRSYVFYRNLFIPAMLALGNIEHEGMQVDRDLLLSYIDSANDSLEVIVATLRKYPQVLAFEEFKAKAEKLKAIGILEEKIATTLEKETEKLEAKKEKILNTISELEQKYESVFDPKLLTKINAERVKLNGLQISNKHVENWKDQINKIKVGIDQVYEGINFASPAQLSELLYSEAGFNYEEQYDYKKREKTKSTDRKILANLDDYSGFIAEFIGYKSIQHTLSTYLNGILERLDENNRLHTSYSQLVETGRISSRDPNLQNIPPEGRLKHPIANKVSGFIKRTFTVPEGCVLLEADYSQAELRLVAFYADETNMLESYARGEDLHIKTGCRIKGVTIAEYFELPKDQQKPIRQNAKAANFGLCLTADTDIMTKRGIIKIPEVVVGDYVLTHKGNWKQVKETQKLVSEFIYKISTNTGKEVKSTGDHLWYATIPSANGRPSVKAWIEASELLVGQYLTANNSEGSHGNSIYGESISKFIGWYLAEGNYSGTLRIKQSKKANPDVHKVMQNILCTELGFNEFNSPSDNGVSTFRCSQAIFYSKFQNLLDFSLKSKDKTFDFAALSRNDKINVLAGLWDGDGNIQFRIRRNSTVSIQYTSISIKLLVGIKDCLMSLGINSKIYQYENMRCNVLHVVGVESRRRFLSLIPTVKVLRGKYDETNNWSAEEKIVKIEKLRHNDFVYDLTVEDDHSFIANGLVSHNCYGQGENGYMIYAKDNYGVLLSKQEAKEQRNLYFKMYPKLEDYHYEVVQKAKQLGYIRTLFGYRRFLEDIRSSDNFLKGEAERQAINTPIQGTAGQLTLFSIVLLYNRLPKGVRIVNTVHDSIMFQVPKYLLDETKHIIRETMENLPILKYFGKEIPNVKMLIDFKISEKSWGEMVEI